MTLVDAASVPARPVVLGRFADRCDLDPVVEAALDSVANAVETLAGGRYTAKDRRYPASAFRLLSEVGYRLDAAEIAVWLRLDGRVVHGREDLVALVSARRKVRDVSPWRADILEQWRATARGPRSM